MDVLTSETCWALNNEIIKRVTSSWSLFIHIYIYIFFFFKCMYVYLHGIDRNDITFSCFSTHLKLFDTRLTTVHKYTALFHGYKPPYKIIKKHIRSTVLRKIFGQRKWARKSDKVPQYEVSYLISFKGESKRKWSVKFAVGLRGMSTAYRRLDGRPQDKSISLFLDVTPCMLVNILRYVTSKNGPKFLVTAVTNASLTERQSQWGNLSLRKKIPGCW